VNDLRTIWVYHREQRTGPGTRVITASNNPDGFVDVCVLLHNILEDKYRMFGVDELFSSVRIIHA